MYRTPEKKTDDTTTPDMEKQGSSRSETSPTKTSKVRKSIGEWENGKGEISEKIARPKGKAVDVERQIKKTASVKEVSNRTPTKTTANKPKQVDILTEAKECFKSALEKLGLARNIKTEIRQEVTLAIERMHYLLKEVVKENINLKQKREAESTIRERMPEPEKETTTCGPNIICKMEEHAKLIETSNKKIQKLQDTLDKFQSIQEKNSYASVAAGAMNRPLSSALATHSVAITSVDEKETGEQVLEKIRNVIKAKNEGYKIDKIRKAKDRKIIVGCSTEQEINRIKDSLRSAGSGLKVEEIKNKDPLIVLGGVMNYINDQDIPQAIKKQNKDLLKEIKDEDLRMEVRYRKRARNPLTSHVVLRVSPIVWSRLTAAESVHVDLQRVPVADQSPLVQCSKCLGYGHTKRLCTEDAEVCSHCGGPHLRTECTSWLAAEPPSCRNCLKAKTDRRDHNAFSVECPVRRRWESLARSTIAYC